MKKLLLLAPALLVACAPAYTGSRPGPNEIIVEAVPSPYASQSSTLSAEQQAGVMGFSVISVLLIRNQTDASGLPDGYTSFTFPNGAASMQRVSAEDRPMHIKISWQASKPSTQDTVNVEWESRPLGGKYGQGQQHGRRSQHPHH